MYYGYNNSNKFGKDKIYKVFVDFGHSKCTVGISSFQKSNFQVMETFSERFCGGRDMDMMILNHVCEKFFLEQKIDLLSNKKAMMRLITEIQKTRKILTSNNESQIIVEFIINDLDLSYHLKRDEFEKICKPTFDIFENLLIKAKIYLDSINLSNCFTIEMAGECMRTPYSQFLVKKIFNKEINKTVLIDECISKGCSIYVNNLMK